MYKYLLVTGYLDDSSGSLDTRMSKLGADGWKFVAYINGGLYGIQTVLMEKS